MGRKSSVITLSHEERKYLKTRHVSVRSRPKRLTGHVSCYSCEKRDPDFDGKMHNVLLVYKQLSMRIDEDGQLIPWEEDEEDVHILSYDEKPGIQAIENDILVLK